jgi:hypothetical protein
MLIFDPVALPDDYDARAHGDPLAVIEPLCKEGRIYWLDTESDGGYSLGVCTSGEVRPEHAAFARQVGVAERFVAPGGRLYFTGIEYAFRHNDSLLRKYPHMGSYQMLAAGVYRLTIYELDYPEDFHEELLRERLGAGTLRLYSLMNLFVPLGCLSALALVASAFKLGLRVWSRTALPLCAALMLPAFVLPRLRPYREAERARRAVETEYPDYLAVLQPLSSE